MFSVSLGMASVATPLLAVRSGYSGIEVGLLVAVSALTQMATRLVLGRAMRIVGDWVLVVAAAALLAGSNALLALTAAAVPFILAATVQGVARACFWTGSQTHVVRGPGTAVGALAQVNFISSLGLLAGPTLAGILAELSLQTAFGVAALVAVAAVVPALLLDRLPPFQPPPDRPPGQIWRRPGVATGCWAGASAGAWRGLLGSYVPVALEAARQPGTTTGALVSVANAASVVGAVVVGRVRERWVRRSL
ncbi:MAG: MFS transporter, partial [Actinomycetota bacterium]